MLLLTPQQSTWESNDHVATAHSSLHFGGSWAAGPKLVSDFPIVGVVLETAPTARASSLQLCEQWLLKICS